MLIVSLNIFSAFFSFFSASGLSHTYFVPLKASYKPFFTLCILLLFLLLRWDNFKCLVFEFTGTSICLIKSAVEAPCCTFLIMVIVFVHSSMSVRFHFMISISLLNSLFCSCTVFPISSSCLSLFSCSSVSFFKTIILNCQEIWGPPLL